MTVEREIQVNEVTRTHQDVWVKTGGEHFVFQTPVDIERAFASQDDLRGLNIIESVQAQHTENDKRISNLESSRRSYKVIHRAAEVCAGGLAYMLLLPSNESNNFNSVSEVAISALTIGGIALSEGVLHQGTSEKNARIDGLRERRVQLVGLIRDLQPTKRSSKTVKRRERPNS